MLNYGLIIKTARKKAGVSQKDLADMVGVTKEAVFLWEHGKRQITLNNADKVFSALGISVTIGVNHEEP